MPTGWAAGPSDVIGLQDAAREETDVFNAAEARISLRGAVNEVVAFTYILRAENIAFSGVEIAATDWTGPAGVISRDHVRIYRHWPIVMDRYPNWYLRSTGLREARSIPDALVPIDAPRHGQPYSIPRGENLVFWIELRIPPETHVGRYTSELLVRSASGGASRVKMQLDVLDLYFDPADALPVVAQVQLKPLIAAHTQLDADNPRIVSGDTEARRVITDTFRLLREHGLSPVTTDVYPRWSQDQDGGLVLDWTDFDALCGPLIDGSAYDERSGAAAWPLPVDARRPDPSQYGGPDSTTYSAVLKDHLTAVTAHFREKGWLDRAYVYFDIPPGDEPTAEDLNRVRRLAALTHLIDPNLPFATKLIPQSMTPFGWFGHIYDDLTPAVDIWMTPARYQHPPTLKRLQTFGKRTWLPPDRPPYSGCLAVEAPPIHARSLPWQAFLQGHEAVVLDEVTAWPADVLDQPIRGRLQRSDSWLVYPGAMFGLGAPVPSVRLKQLQLGLQDHQRLALLAANGREETARLASGSLIKAAGTDAYGDNYQDGLLGRRIDASSTWELARRILDDELHFTLMFQASGDAGGGASNADWARLLSETRTIEAWIESARLRFDDRPDREEWLLSVDVGVRSEMRTPIEGELRFESLPYGMRNVSDTIRMGPLQEWGVARRQLLARSPAVPITNLDGHYTQPVVFDAGASGRVESPATVAIVQVTPAPYPIRIDGHLDDWPPSAFNAAGDFRLVTSRISRGGERPKAQAQTIVYFLEADGMLYIGLHAGAPKGDGEASVDRPPFRNFVEYEDLMPVGEDLVEIILDPSNQATQTSELYHIVLKSTGNPRFEKGIGTHPPIGDVQPWPGPLPECCVVPTEYGWSAEIAIPISSFGPAAEANRVWGLNMARLEPSLGEYSDWARAPRYCYAPRSLGNLIWRE